MESCLDGSAGSEPWNLGLLEAAPTATFGHAQWKNLIKGHDFLSRTANVKHDLPFGSYLSVRILNHK